MGKAGTSKGADAHAVCSLALHCIYLSGTRAVTIGALFVTLVIDMPRMHD